jgi:tRNA (guanine-N7-)-methyltransferase
MGKNRSCESHESCRQGRLIIALTTRGAKPNYMSGGLFGRRIGKMLSSSQAADYETGFAAYGIAVDLAPLPDLPSFFAAPVTRFHLEIGFGSGEHLLTAARRETSTGFIGVEPFINGIAKVCTALNAEKLPNVRLYNQDAVPLLDRLPDASLDTIDLFYPDPWTKKRHWKRRFISPANLDRFARILKPGGQFRFSSDIAHYVNWTLEALDRHPEFTWQASGPDDWRNPYPFWPGSRYEQKALREGRVPAYLTFVRV